MDEHVERLSLDDEPELVGIQVRPMLEALLAARRQERSRVSETTVAPGVAQ